MKKSILVMVLGLATVSVYAQTKKPAAAATKPATKPAVKTATATANPFKNEIDSVSYSIGLLVAQNLKAQGIENVNLALFQRALSDATLNKKPLLSDDAVKQSVMNFQQKINAVKNAAAEKENASIAVGNKQAGQAFLAANGKRPGVVTLPDGLQYEILKASTDNTKPTLTTKVKVHYHGTLINGTVFDSSVDRGEPIVYPVNGFVRGWQEILQLMPVGSKWKVYVPSDLGYGDSGSGKVGPGSTMIFELELLGIEP